MPVRPKTTARDLPPRMLRVVKRLKSGKEWVGYYYSAPKGADGKRAQIPLGTDLVEAKRKWAELECAPAPADTRVLSTVFDRYERDVIPTKAPVTQKGNLKELANLRAVFGSAPIDAVTPAHIAQYRDKRGQTAKTRANRELALLSHIFNMAREWGYTARDNPARGVRKHRETPRDYYADESVWQAVYSAAATELQDAMDLAYLTGQRPADVRKMKWADVRDGALTVQQGKTGKKLRILLADAGQPTALAALLDRIRQRPRPIAGLTIVASQRGQPLSVTMLRKRFDAARQAAALANTDQAARIAAFQFRDIRAKAASDTDTVHAKALLGHSTERITSLVYQRVGAAVRPTK